MSILLPVAQRLNHCQPLRVIQFSVGEIDLGLCCGQPGPFQCVEGVVRKEYFAHKRAGEKSIETPEGVQEEIRTGCFSPGEFLLANSDD